jgi:hypothetical protein
MPSTFEDFATGTSAQQNDWIVGYDTAVLGGERKWTVNTLAKAVSGAMELGLQPFGGGTDNIFFQSDNAMTSDYTVPAGKNNMAIGPLTINNGKTLTVSAGSTCTILM